MTAKQKVQIKPLEGKDKPGLSKLSGYTEALSTAYDFGGSDISRIFKRGKPQGLIARKEGERVPVGAIYGFDPDKVPLVWEHYLGEDYKQGLPTEYNKPGIFIIDFVATRGHGRRELAKSLVDPLAAALQNAGYNEIVSYAPLEVTGCKPEELGFEPVAKLPHFWVYPGVDEEVTIFRRKLDPAEK